MPSSWKGLILFLFLLFTSNEGLSGLAGAWRDAVNSGAMQVRERSYWTTADCFPDMAKTCPEMLQELAQAKLVIFKVRRLILCCKT